MSEKMIDTDLILKPIRETVDWLLGHYKNIKNDLTKEQLSQIANQISKLITNKIVYIDSFRKEFESNEPEINSDKLKTALETAEEDTKKLNGLLKEFKFDSKAISFSLLQQLESLTALKLGNIQRAKDLFLKSEREKQMQIINDLESFQQKWLDIGNEIDAKFR